MPAEVSVDDREFKRFVEKEGHDIHESDEEALAILKSRWERGETEAFERFGYHDGLNVLKNLSEDEFPTKYRSFQSPGAGTKYFRFADKEEGFGQVTHFGFVDGGEVELHGPDGTTHQLTEGMYFSVPDEFVLSTQDADARGIIVSRLGYKGFFQVGGPIEETGRLEYIDGCTDSLLIPPVIKGDACLNLLHFPPGIDQTAHTHPSMRIGLITGGEGWCRIDEERKKLEPGVLFSIQPEGLHAFMTEDSEMTVIAYHPDSDTGPEHDDHPMVNRTIVDGESAAFIEDIRTRFD